VSWTDPTTADIKSSASLLALALPSITPFLFSPNTTFTQYTSPGRIDVGLWTDGGKTLVLASNLNYANATLDLAGVPDVPGEISGGGWHTSQVLDSGGVVLDGTTMEFQSVGSGGFILSSSDSGSSPPNSRANIAPATVCCVRLSILLVIVTVACLLS
jgi:hypothetical protein